MRAAVGEAGLQDEWLSDICRERLSQSVDLLLQLGHRPRLHHLFQDPHMSRKVFTGITVELRVGRNDGNLLKTSQYESGAFVSEDLPSE